MVVNINNNETLVFMIQSDIIYVLTLFSIKRVSILLIWLDCFYVLKMFYQMLKTEGFIKVGLSPSKQNLLYLL